MTGSPVPTGQWLLPPDGKRWFFDSGSLSLDFGYTGDFGYGVPAWEHLHSPADLEEWLAGRFGPPAHTPGPADLAAALRLRGSITAAARRVSHAAPAEPADVDVVNEFAAHPAIPPFLPGGTLEPAPPTPAQMLASLAHDAVRTLAGDRVRECAGDNCRLIFLDTSRPGTRRWCSMSRCGGRAKARAHYARRT